MSAATMERPAQHDAQAVRQAYNHAFHELGLPWHWDETACQRIEAARSGRDAVREYLEAEQSHLLRAYDADFLVDAIEAAKQRVLRARG